MYEQLLEYKFKVNFKEEKYIFYPKKKVIHYMIQIYISLSTYQKKKSTIPSNKIRCI